MKRLFLIAVSCALLASPLALGSTNIITVSGSGEVSTKPDMATLHFAVTLRGKKMEELKADADETAGTLTALFRELGIPDEDILRSNLLIQPYQGKDRDVYTGYQVARSFTVEVNDLSLMHGLLEGLTAAGINRVDHIAYGSTEEEGHEDKALKKAALRARQKATVAAEALSCKLGPAVHINEGQTSFGGDDFFGGARAYSTSAEQAPQPGRITFSAEVTVTFALERSEP